MENLIAVHETNISENIVRMVKEESLKENILELILNGDLHGLFFDEDGEIVAEDIWGNRHEDIIE